MVLAQQEDPTYQLHTEFKSHDSEFDCLTSTEIEEKINTIKWFPFNGHQQQLMTTNGKLGEVSTNIFVWEKMPILYLDKTIKLFRMWERTSDGSAVDVMVKPKKVFEGAHAYNINSVSFNSDGETFISSDDLRINLWSLANSKEAFSTCPGKIRNSAIDFW